MLKDWEHEVAEQTLPVRLGAYGLTEKQRGMLLCAEACSLPGDGLRIKGPGEHRSASGLERSGLVRVARPSDGQKARVHVTENGRIVARFLAREAEAP